MSPLGWSSIAMAHEPGLSDGRLVDGGLTLTFSADDLAAVDGRYEVLGAVSLSVDGRPCALGPVEPAPVDGGLQLARTVDCPAGPVTYRAAFLYALPDGHRHVLEVDGAPAGLLDRSSPETTVAGRVGAGEVALDYVRLGVEHIWTGYDHLLFLAALLLVARSLREMLGVVTGFTMAHSVTLSAAALGLVTLPSAVVEPAIAATIAFVGVENLWRPTGRRRFLTTFALGLIHGFGFAGLLRELGMPQEHLVTALLAFNGGVELGQAAVVLVVLPALLAARRLPGWEARTVPVLSLAIAGAGLYWLIERVLP